MDYYCANGRPNEDDRSIREGVNDPNDDIPQPSEPPKKNEKEE